MVVARAVPGLVFCLMFTASSFTNKYVLSVLKFTYPTLFQGWQTCTGALLLYLTWRFGWVELSLVPRAAAVSWFPGSVLFLGNIYGGSKAFSVLPIPLFLLLLNMSDVIFCIVSRWTHRQKSSWMRTFSEAVVLLSATTVILHNPQFGPVPYFWTLVHCLCVGSYRVYQRRFSHMSEPDQQFLNYTISILLLLSAAHPTGDLLAVSAFPHLRSYEFHGGCCCSAVLNFSLFMASVRLKRAASAFHWNIWIFLSKVTTSALSVFVFGTDLGSVTWFCVLMNHAAEGCSIYADRTPDDQEP